MLEVVDPAIYTELFSILQHLETSIATEVGTQTLTQFLEALKKQEADGKAPVSPCTTVWRSGVVAYRCKTCQKSPNSALCVSCFQVGGKLSSFLRVASTLLVECLFEVMNRDDGHVVSSNERLPRAASMMQILLGYPIIYR